MQSNNRPKIQVIFPVANQAILAANQNLRLEVASQQGVQASLRCLERGPETIETLEDEQQAYHPLMQVVSEAEEQGFDGVCIDCAADPWLSELRQKFNLTVVGAGEASYLLAMAMVQRFAVIAVLDATADIIRSNLQRSGFGSRVAAVSAVGIPVSEVGSGETVIDRLFAESERLIAQGAQAIVLGCTGMAWTHEPLRNRLSVPVIEPAAASIQVLAAVVRQQGGRSTRARSKQQASTVSTT